MELPDGAGLSLMLRALRGSGPHTRQQLGEHACLSRPQVNQRLQVLRELGLVDDGAATSSSVGRPPRAVLIRRGRGFVLSCALGVKGLVVSMVDLSGELVDDRQEDMDVAMGPAVVLGRCVQLCNELTAAAAGGEPWGVGISVPGPVDYAKGAVVSPPVMPGWDQFPIRGWMSDKLNAPCWVDNDANAMAVGEHRYGAGRGHDDLVCVKIGSGIGSGIIMSGALQRGDKGCAGDIGHLPIMGSHVPCRCGNVGCLEAVAGGLALTAVAEGLAQRGESSVLTETLGGRPATAADLTRAAELGDTTCLAILQEAGERIGSVLANVVSLPNPSQVIIGGGLSHAGEMLFTAIRKSLYAHALPLASRDLLLRTSVLGDKAAVYGTAELVLDQLFSPAILQRWFETRSPQGQPALTERAEPGSQKRIG